MSDYVAKSLLDSKGEGKVFATLGRYDKDLIAHVGVRFFRIIKPSIPGLTSDEKSYLYKTEFDFVVYDKKTMAPLFGLDWDGIGGDYEKFDEKRPWKKAVKQKACEIAGFPFVWLETFEQIDGTTILDAMIGSLIGGQSYARMIESGYLHWEEQFIYDFPPFVTMNERYGHYARVKACGPWRDRSHGHSIYTFMTDNGEITIEKTARVTVVNFPYFHSTEVASDLASYRCLKEFERRLNRGEISVAQIDARRMKVCEEVKARQQQRQEK